jgi:hypothetical protein
VAHVHCSGDGLWEFSFSNERVLMGYMWCLGAYVISCRLGELSKFVKSEILMMILYYKNILEYAKFMKKNILFKPNVHTNLAVYICLAIQYSRFLNIYIAKLYFFF